MSTAKDGKKITCLGQIVILLFFGGCVYGAWLLIGTRMGPGSNPTTSAATDSNTGNTAAEKVPAENKAPGKVTEIGIAYGTEKERWLKKAAESFAQTPEGRGIKVNLIPMGSVEGGQAVIAGDERIHVWSPASALYKDVVEQEWQLKHNRKPFIREEALALSPMVFVFWKERYDAFNAKFGEVSFKTISDAIQDPGGWNSIANKPEWGLFKFGHTHPNESNSGLMTLVLMAYNYSDKTRNLELKDILNPGFQSWMTGIERGVSGLSNSTGNMMKQMVLRGPSSFDVLFVYENVVIDYLKNAEGRWGELQVVYPAQNMWNDNPYYILDAPWSSKEQRNAAGKFLDYLLTESVQAESLVHGFRPGNPAIGIKGPESPFETYAQYGIQVDLQGICEAPKAEVLTNLLSGWQRSVGGR